MSEIQHQIWEMPAWRTEVHSWISAMLKRENISLCGEITQDHIRPWSTVLTVPTDAGLCYFKAAAPALHHEAALTEALARWEPVLLPNTIAVDIERGWMLMRSSGVPLRQFIRGEKSLARWQPILREYVGFQKRLASRTDEMTALGTFDRRLATLPQKFSALLANESAMLLDEDESLTSAEYARLKELVPVFEEMCAELTSFGFPETLHHDDFHDANVFMQNEQPIFTDWGESAVTHPLFTLIVLLRGAENSLGCDEYAPEIAELRDMLLANWQDVASPADLQKAAALALKIGLVNRALTWRHVIDHMIDKADYAVAVPSYLKDFLNAVEHEA